MQCLCTGRILCFIKKYVGIITWSRQFSSENYLNNKTRVLFGDVSCIGIVSHQQDSVLWLIFLSQIVQSVSNK